MSIEEQATGQGLSHGQRQIWVGQRLTPQSPLYNMAFAWIFDGELDPDLFGRAWQRAVHGSDALHTVIDERDGRPERRILPSGSLQTEILALSWEEADRGAAFLHWCRRRASQPLNVDGPLVDSVLVSLGDGRSGWYLNQHHLVTDARSTALLYRQVAAEYAALRDGGASPEPLSPYAETIASLPSRPRALERAAAHWQSRHSGGLEGGSGAVPLYGLRGKPADTASRRRTLPLDDRLKAGLDDLCSADGFASLSPDMSRFAVFGTLLTAWLHRISGREHVSFDGPVAGRPNPASKRALGVFIELFPFAASIEGGETFRSLGAKCLAETQCFLQHALPGTSQPPGAVARNVVLNYVPETFGDFAGTPAQVEWVHPGHGDHVHALRLQVHRFGGDWTLHFDFNTSVWPDQLQERALEHVSTLLDAMIEDPDAALAAVDLRTDAEKQAWDAFNATAEATPEAPLPSATVLDLFKERAASKPNRPALRQGEETWTFGELARRVDALAAALRGRGVQPGEPVAVHGRRSVHTVLAILAVLQARGAYVPIDPAYPSGRIASILQDAGARFLLAGLGDGAPDGAEIQVLEIEAEWRRGEAMASPDAAAASGPSSGPSPSLDDLAYVLYTSGSTGRPKGVLVGHDGLADYVAWAARHYVRGESMCFALCTSLGFDLTVTSLFLPLITGGVLEIYPQTDGPVDSAVVEVARQGSAEFLKLTPSHLSLLRQMDVGDWSLRRLIVGGEDFKTGLAAEIQALFGDDLEIYNEYGPTEAVVGCVVHRFDAAADGTASVPIGHPSDHVQLEVLDASGTPVPEGVPGELCIARHGLARGYLGLDDLTAERFVEGADGARRYRTGDRVRWQDGVLHYLGRLDRQLKLSGYRIEPAEVEAALEALPGVRQSAVVARRPSVETVDAVVYCVRCGLPSNHPKAEFDDEGVCGVCRTYDAVKDYAQSYFKTQADLRELFDGVQARRAARGEGQGAYDCMMLFSGGKDSTYALCQLVDMGLSVYAFTLDNGFISEGAKANVRRVAEQLGVAVEFATTPAMNAIFRDSLQRFANVCQGCFKTIYTLATQRARELNIPVVVTGLSRGQMFETRLTEEMFRDGHRSAEEVDAAVLAARKVYHRLDDAVSRNLDVGLFQNDRIFEQVQFVDYYRYHDVGLSEVLGYLQKKVPWVRPEDTGRSTNCLINDVGIHVHQQQMGYHNYALPYSWDVRLGHKTREQAHAELHDEIDLDYVRRTLEEIGCDVDQMMTDRRQPQLVAYLVVEGPVDEDALRQQLAERLPAPLIPSQFQTVDAIPLTAHGKVDEAALPALDIGSQADEAPYRAPDGPVQEYLAEVWQELLSCDRVGADDHFFRLGGASLGAMEVMIRLGQEFVIDLPLETVFNYPVLGDLAHEVEERLLADMEPLG